MSKPIQFVIKEVPRLSGLGVKYEVFAKRRLMGLFPYESYENFFLDLRQAKNYVDMRIKDYNNSNTWTYDV